MLSISSIIECVILQLRFPAVTVCNKNQVHCRNMMSYMSAQCRSACTQQPGENPECPSMRTLYKTACVPTDDPNKDPCSGIGGYSWYGGEE